jgi:excisionase family DNA binding protein
MRMVGSGLSSEVVRRVERITLTMPEAQAFSGLGKNTLLKLLHTGEIQGRRIGARRWLIMRDSLESWLRNGRG